jgi:prefoldin subunit 5
MRIRGWTLTLVSLVVVALLYVVRAEAGSAVSALRERVVALETILPTMAKDITEIKDNVEYIRRNLHQ